MINSIKLLFQEKKFKEIALNYLPVEIVKTLSFYDSLRISYRLLYNDEWDWSLQEYAFALLHEIQKFYPVEWETSWKYDALLGLASYLTCNYEDRYLYYKRAFEKTKNPPAGLLLALAESCICPGKPPISYDEAILLVQKALKEAPYSDAIGLMSHLYSLKDDEKNKKYWLKIFEDCDQEFETPPIEPDFLMEEYLKDANLKSESKKKAYE